jgi:hypothetical protein
MSVLLPAKYPDRKADHPYVGFGDRPRSSIGRTSRGMTGPASYSSWPNGRMAETITFRPDEDASRALDVLTRDGTSVSMAVREALIDAARERAGRALRAEAAALADDPADRAESAQVLRDMETLRAW